jgi:hypothetical protein
MIIIDFDIVSIASFPYKADPPLLVYPNAVLSRAFSFQGFKLISRWYIQLSELIHCIDLKKLA